MGTGDHAARIARAFTAQAAAFEDPAVNRPFTTDAAWIAEHVAVGPDDLVLDVAAGTGIVARALAPRARAVVALDATAAMLEAGRAAAASDGIANVVFLLGDATALPFLDASFDVAVTRFSLHHLEEPARARGASARATIPVPAATSSTRSSGPTAACSAIHAASVVKGRLTAGSSNAAACAVNARAMRAAWSPVPTL